MLVALSAHFWGRETTGSGQYLHRLVAALREAAPTLDLLLVGDTAAATRQMAPPLPPGVRWQRAPTPFDGRQPNLAKLWFEQVAFPRAAARAGADLLHIPYFAAPLRPPRPVVVTIHDLIPLLLPAYRGSTLVRGYTALVARAARGAARVLADSEASRRDILVHLRLDPTRVATVYLGVDAQFRPQPAAAVAALRQRLDLPERFVLYLGGFDVRKAVPTLLAATAQSLGDWPLVVAGRLPTRDTPFTPDPRRVAADLRLGERVHFVGWVAEAMKPALLSAAAIFAFPSTYEGFGLPVLEAMACGVATVTTSASSLPELAGAAALTVPPGESAALAATLDQLMGDDVARRALAARGPAQAARFSWATCAAQTAAAYAAAAECT